MSDKMAEVVMCRPVSFLGSVEGVIENFSVFDLMERHVWLPRSLAETDPSHKQIIPYVIIRMGNRIIRYERAGTEGRLHGLFSIGIGGHINREDYGYGLALCREIKEEIGITTLEVPRIIGLVNDNSTSVGRVHVGIVHLFDIPESAELSFDELRNPQWVGHDEAMKDLNGYEVWSKLCLRHLEKVIFP
jgi:predicted NUDIX family phosphoesterase